MTLLFILSILQYQTTAVLFAMAGFGIYMGTRVERNFFKHLFFNGSAIILAIALFEGYLTKVEFEHSKFDIYEELVLDKNGKSHFLDNELLGYGAVDQGSFRAQKRLRHSGEIVYEAEYNYNNGVRYTPSSSDEAEDCMHVFGCSYTFGHGLDDTATLPHYMGELTNHPFQIINHGFDGYGLHQILQQVEQLVHKKEACRGRKIAIYPYLFGHISRAAGYASWDRFGPHYEIDNGKLKHVGPFEHRSSIWTQYFDVFLAKSKIYKRFVKHYFRPITDLDIERGLAMILKCNRLLSENDFEFEVFIYDIQEHIVSDFGSQARYKRTLEVLRKAGVKMHFLSDVIEDYDENMDKYTISKHDLHPNALSNKLVAAYFSTLYRQEQ